MVTAARAILKRVGHWDTGALGKGAVLPMGLHSLPHVLGQHEFPGLWLRAPGSAGGFGGTRWYYLFLQPL